MNSPDPSPSEDWGLGPQDAQFAERAAGLLRQGAGELDAATRSQLNRARQRALAEFDRRTSPRVRARYPGTALLTAAVALCAVALWTGGRWPGHEPNGSLPLTAPNDAGADLDLVLADANLDMLENLDFYEALPAIEYDPGAAGDLETTT